MLSYGICMHMPIPLRIPGMSHMSSALVKVGAALSMVYVTGWGLRCMLCYLSLCMLCQGQPVVFVGTGQKCAVGDMLKMLVDIL